MKLRVDTLLIKIQFLILSGIVIVQVLGQDSIASALFTLTFFLTVAVWLIEAKKRITRTNLLALGILILSFLAVVLNAMTVDAALSFSYVKKMIIFWSTVLFFAAAAQHTPDRSTVRLVFRLNTFLAIFLIVMFLTKTNEMYFFDNRITTYLTFNFTNPNLTSVFLLAMSIVQMIRAYTEKRGLGKVLHTALAVVLVVFLVLTRARNALLVMVFYVVVYLGVILFPRHRWRMSKRMAALIAVFPLLFAVGYMFLIYTPFIQNIFAFLVDKGKGLDARVGMWEIAFETIAAHPVLGAYGQIYTDPDMMQMHNTHLDVAATYGIAVMVMLCVFLFRILRGAKGQGKQSFLCMMGFAVLLMSGMGEAMVFSGGLGIYIYFGVLRMLANYQFDSAKIEL